MCHISPCTHLVLALPLQLLQAVALHLLRGHVLHHLTLSCRLCLHGRAVQACGVCNARPQVHTCCAVPLHPAPPATSAPKSLACSSVPNPTTLHWDGTMQSAAARTLHYGGLYAWLKQQVFAVKDPTCSSASSPARSRADWAECNCSRLTRLLARATFSSAQCMSRRWSSSMARRSLATCRNRRGLLDSQCYEVMAQEAGPLANRGRRALDR